MMKVKTLLPLGIVSFITLYMAYAFVNWDIVWVIHVDAINRFLFVLFCVSLFMMSLAAYLEFKSEEDKD
ncbi:MAG: hypothetical protein ACFNM8_06750 [Prevotella histicola]|uniref:hypothetical protein n=1 Tax=Prevotella histicola TaxID=470565 RepID=UPI003616DB45